MSDWLRARKDGVELTIRLTPRSSSDRIERLVANADGMLHLAARVRAVPENGKANIALEELVASWADVPKRAVSVTGGTTSRLKTVLITGDPAVLAPQLIALAKS